MATSTGIAKADMPKFMPPEPDNDTDVDATIDQVKQNDGSLKELNWNNIRVCLLLSENASIMPTSACVY